MAEIDGRKLTIWTNHQAIVGAFRNEDALRHDPTALNHLIERSNWTTDVKYFSGPLNPVVDTLSRPDLASCGTENVPATASSASSPSAKDVLIETSALKEVTWLELWTTEKWQPTKRLT